MQFYAIASVASIRNDCQHPASRQLLLRTLERPQSKSPPAALPSLDRSSSAPTLQPSAADAIPPGSLHTPPSSRAASPLFRHRIEQRLIASSLA
ncbi:hypothetical protein TgHK011_000854 [Trichoderma gracile]|nr:hypothetical protein TgHK011_000854 [Trichoderma gracile]